MQKARLHKFIALLLLLAFTSQTMATAAMSCERKNEAGSQNISMTEMDVSAMDMNKINHSDPAMAHMHHQMSETNHAQNQHQKFDCCKTMDHCLTGGCTLAAVSSDITLPLNKADSAVEDFYLGIAPTPLISSLYRPPIFC